MPSGRGVHDRVRRTQLVPGPTGATGATGATGPQGIPQTVTIADFVQPTLGGLVDISFGVITWVVPGEPIYVQGAGTFAIGNRVGSTNAYTCQLLAGVASTGTTIASAALVGPSGLAGPPGQPGPTGPPGNAGSLPSPPQNISALIYDSIQDAWRVPTADDILPGFGASFTGGTSIEIGDASTAVALPCTWSSTATPASAVFTDTDSNTINILSTHSFNSPAYFKTARATINMTATITPVGGVPVKVLVQPVHVDSRSFWGTHTTGVSSQADMEGLASSQLVAGRGQNISANVGVGQSLVGYFPKDVYTTAPTFLFGAIPTGFNVTSVTYTRRGVAQDWWRCESPSDDTGNTSVTVQ